MQLMRLLLASPLTVMLASTLLQSQARPASAPADMRLVGSYELPDGAPVFVLAQDDGRLTVAFGGGEVRGLALRDGAWVYGPSIGVVDPIQGSLRFDVTGTAPASAVEWLREGTTSIRADRVALREREVSFSGAGVQLVGTIISPAAAARGGIVMLHGSGVETRESSRAFAYLLAREGVASLIYDKRASGKSTGSSVDVPFADLAADAVAALAALRDEPELRGRPVGLFGPSQGGWIALEASRRSPDIAFIVLQSGDATSPLEQEMYRGEQLLRLGTKLSSGDIQAGVAFRRQKFMYAITGQGKPEFERARDASRNAPWFSSVGDRLPNVDFWKPNGLYDPIPALTGFRGPLLAVFGARDVSKDVELNARQMRAAFAAGANAGATTVVIPGANHGMFETATGLPLERELPKLSRIAPEYLRLLAEWVGARAREAMREE